jgi:hypothetical protein
VPAKFQFQGEFTYPDAATRDAAILSFAQDSALFRGPPIPVDAIRHGDLRLGLDYERTTDEVMEWTGLLDQVAALAIGANGGELIAVYDGSSGSGATRERVRLKPGPELEDADAPIKKRKNKSRR